MSRTGDGRQDGGVPEDDPGDSPFDMPRARQSAPEDPVVAEVHRPVPVFRLGTAAESVEVVATEAELPAVAARLRIPAVASLTCTFVLRRGDDKARGQITADGVLRARVTQECVVTLDPFESGVGEAFRLHFVRAGTEVDDLDPESDDEVPYEGETIDLGEAAVEQLALTLDPYPRKPGAELPEGAGEAPASPFAMLARRNPTQ